MMRGHSRMSHVLVAALLLGLVAMVVAAFLAPSGPTHAARSPYMREAQAPQKTDDTYSDLLAAARKGDVAGLELDARTNKAAVVYKDAREADVTLPPDNGALLSRKTVRLPTMNCTAFTWLSPTPVSRTVARDQRHAAAARARRFFAFR